MTMDITSRVAMPVDNSSQHFEPVQAHEYNDRYDKKHKNNYIEDLTLLPKRTTQKTKRSFDVAFLITPDENLVKKQMKEKQEAAKTDYVSISPVISTPENLILENKRNLEQDEIDSESMRSAFKKVGLQKNIELKYSQSPSSVSSISGGCSYQESRSPSPCSIIDPVRTPSPQNYKNKPETYPPIIQNTLFNNMDLFLKQNLKSDEKVETKQKKYTEVSPFGSIANVYPFPSFQQQPRTMQSEITRRNEQIFTTFPNIGLNRNNFIPTPIFNNNILAAQLPLSASLIPSSLAALTLPAQNICAKCNVSFRMTSDLVYHMRSHHKNEHATSDSLRRRRELDKLRCPVCNETFRERHHLTRHMTAHQDKDGDDDHLKNYSYKEKNRKAMSETDK